MITTSLYISMYWSNYAKKYVITSWNSVIIKSHISLPKKLFGFWTPLFFFLFLGCLSDFRLYKIDSKIWFLISNLQIKGTHGYFKDLDLPKTGRVKCLCKKDIFFYGPLNENVEKNEKCVFWRWYCVKNVYNYALQKLPCICREPITKIMKI